VLGMVGGVWEWVMDWYDPFYYQNGPSVDPSGPGQTRDKVLRGGAFDNAIWKLRTAHRHYGGAEGYAHDHGFRCARTP
jgi:sulfatase modifying factor 1